MAGDPDGGFVAAVARTTGIHPRSARLVALGLLEVAADGAPGRTWHAVLRIDADPGPEHLHWLDAAELARGRRFGRVLDEVSDILDGRTLVVHDAPLTWGFIVEEARRARQGANRANRSRNRRGGRPRPTPAVGRTPAPARIVDTLATARRTGARLDDPRLLGVARAHGVPAPSPVASVDNIGLAERDRTLAELEALRRLHLAQVAADPAAVMSWAPGELRADPAGLQRSRVRVDAMEAPRPTPNPGRYPHGGALAPGMEFTVADEVELPADEIIAAGVAAGLAYSEKITRACSVLVFNQPADLPPAEFTGKAMHAHRKGVPLVADAAFLRLAADLAARR